MNPGIHPHVPFGQYLNWPVLSQSVLKEGRASMLHLKAALDAERVKEPTDAMILGSALHTAFLEPEQVVARVAKWDGGVRRGKQWDAFCAEHAGKTILTETMHEHLCGMCRALRKHPRVREWLGKIEDTEVSIVGEIAGVPMKARCDALTTDPLVDLKKVSSADLRVFTRTIIDYGYDIQGYVYRKLFNRERVMFVAVEDSPPYDVVCYELSPAFLRRGERETIELLNRYKFACERGVWPGRADDIVLVEPPEWAMEEAGEGVTIGGAAAF